MKHEVGTNRTVLFVHPSNTVVKLSKAQLKGIFTGKISNWKDVGGADKEIIVVWGKGTPGQNAQFTTSVLDGEPVAKDVLESTNYAKIKETVSATPEAIGIDPFGLADKTVNVIEVTLSDQPVIAVTLGKPHQGQKLLDYVAAKARRTRGNSGRAGGHDRTCGRHQDEALSLDMCHVRRPGRPGHRQPRGHTVRSEHTGRADRAFDPYQLKTIDLQRCRSIPRTCSGRGRVNPAGVHGQGRREANIAGSCA